ncbi:MAG: glycosyltransferase family 2 protein [Bacteroidota bacterium]
MTINPGADFDLPFVYVALPVMDEPEFLPRLLNCIAGQSYRRFKLFVCINQPESWWNEPDKIVVCENNAKSLKILQDFKNENVTFLDFTSRGRGWAGKRHGVGWARKTLMDHISKEANPGDIIVSLDADTFITPDYLLSVALNFKNHPGAVALAVPYFHKTTSDIIANRAILRYEIYMRHYFLNLERIGSPYAFTALGSAMALPVWAYRAIGGMTPKLSGEDFYFLQKLRKYGEILLWNDEMVYPEARFSDRVFFGTGPAMIKGAAGDWSSYPVYPPALFDEILETYLLLPVLYLKSMPTAIARFMIMATKERDPFHPLRLNHKDPDHFSRAFHEKFDGLRMLQFLKNSNENCRSTDEENLREYMNRFYLNTELEKYEIDLEKLSFSESPVNELEKIRSFLFDKEMEVRVNSTHV